MLLQLRQTSNGDPYFKEMKDLHAIGLTAKTINSIKHLNTMGRLCHEEEEEESC